MPEPRWDLLDKIPDDMPITDRDYHIDPSLTIAVWRDALGHPYAEGHGFCKTCGAGITCALMAFYDAVVHSTVRELEKMGALVPRETSAGE
jgi:hypothetical protein